MHTSVGVVVDVGDLPILLRTGDTALVELLEHRFHRFVRPSAVPAFEFDVAVVPERAGPQENGGREDDEELDVMFSGGYWTLRRGDFHAELSPAERRGRIRQALNPYAIDSVLRIVHTLLLAGEGGFLLHASSAIRDGRAFLFTGPSGAGKSTIVSLAPGDVSVLTDEVSYVRREGDSYFAYGTPFAGELADVGEPGRAPIASLFKLAHAAVNSREPLDRPAVVRTLMRNILFFAEDRRLAGRILDTACDFADAVPAFTLSFAPDERVWAAIA